MTETAQKKGMSKGCVIGLVVAGVLLVMIIIAIVVIYVYKDDLARYGTNTVLATVQAEVARTPIEGIDSAGFANVCTAFSDKLASEPVDAQQYKVFLQQITAVFSDQRVDSLEAVGLLEAMFESYPELEELYPTSEIPDTTVAPDSVGTEPQ